MTNEVYFSLNDCSLSYGKKKIFEKISFSLHENDKIALIGKNGVGKSSLLKIIAGNLSIDFGELWLSQRIKVGFLNQSLSDKNDLKINDALRNLIKSKEQEYFIDQVCNELKIDKNQNIKELSGGMHRKFNLASIIITNPDLLLLDEPTNHLDIESIKWLENYLKFTFKGSFLVISHNRSFLKKTTNKVFWVDRKKIRVSPKGFSDFEEWSNSLVEQERRELENKKKILNEEMEWMSKGVTARRKRNVRRKNNILIFKNDYEKQRSEFLKSITKTNINISERDHFGPNILVNCYKVNKAFISDESQKTIKKTIISDFSYRFVRGEKIGIIGKNGSGKSTFLKMINDPKLVDEGSIKIKKNIEINYFDQSGIQLDNVKSIKENMIPGGGDYVNVGEKKVHICGYLKNFLFDPKGLDQQVGMLSGGERNRLVLAKILADPKDLLLLDEPTNDLDIETIDILVDFINEFKGCVIITSHDFDFLNKTVDKFLLLDGEGNISKTLNCEDIFLKNVEKKTSNPKILENLKTKGTKPESLEKKIKKILKKIEIKEQHISNLSIQLEQKNKYNNFDYKDNEEIINEIKLAQDDLHTLENEWQNLEEEKLTKGL
jgi:ATP-binding cassette subfamily F protein uup